ncbi:MAG: 3'-5' exonuclease [Clostridia bacterium]|nr:3'-5' exonuclease [Clostridia bacterium]
MNYIIFDLEWNTVFDKKKKKYFGEIIEIGAIKMNDRLELIDKFSETVKPQINKKIKNRTTKLTGIKNSDLETSNSFLNVIEKFQNFIGDIDKTIFMSWSDTDIRTFADNFNYYTGNYKIPFIKYYADMQKFFMQIKMKSSSDQISLQNAADMLNIYCDNSKLHRAGNDALLSYECFRKLYNEASIEDFIISLDDSFYEKLTFVPFYVTDFNSPLIDKNIFKSKCIECGSDLQNKAPWKIKQNGFVNKAVCNNCKSDYLIRVNFKRLYDKLNCSKQIKKL